MKVLKNFLIIIAILFIVVITLKIYRFTFTNTEIMPTGEISENETSVNFIVLNFEIGPQLINCQGFIHQKCMVVNGELFYNSIEGFDFELGYIYKVKVKREQICNPNVINNCPQDVGIYRYIFIEELSKKASVDI